MTQTPSREHVSKVKENLISIAGILVSLVIASSLAIAGSIGGMEVAGLPLLLSCCLFAFVIQWIAFIPAYIFQTEKYFDLLGSLTFAILAGTTLLLAGVQPGRLLIAIMVIIWAARLGSFLFKRIRRVGHDARFRTIKPDFWQFLMTWTIQGLWVFVTFAAGLAAMTTDKAHPIDEIVVLGCALWLTGFLIELIADKQKTEFHLAPENANKFIQQGLWGWSQHPNYFGEILLWTGIAIVAIPVLEGWQYLTLLSPLFVFVLLTKISGVRMLDARAMRKWGQDPDYLHYRQRTPKLLLNPFATGVKA
jgi:steroid 5-alpha reductase family enzyme